MSEATNYSYFFPNRTPRMLHNKEASQGVIRSLALSLLSTPMLAGSPLLGKYHGHSVLSLLCLQEAHDSMSHRYAMNKLLREAYNLNTHVFVSL